MVKIPFFVKMPRIKRNQEIVYDMGYDRIGDAIGVLAILSFMSEKYSVRVSVLYRAADVYDHAWSKGIELLDWSVWQPYAIYRSTNEVPNDAVMFDSLHYFPTWPVLGKLKVYPELREPDYVKARYSDFVLPHSFAAMHVINAVGVRDIEYVKRRCLSMDKYKKIAQALAEAEISTIRLGAVYDGHSQFDAPVIDLTAVTVPLEFSMHIINSARVFIGGDSGLKLAASALGVPVIVEIDDKSKKYGGLNGTREDLLTLVPYGCTATEHIKRILEVLE